MFNNIASYLGYSRLGLIFAGLWLLYTVYFIVLGLATVVLNQFHRVIWLEKLQDYARWGRWNPVHTAVFAWHGWWVSSLITLILMLLIELVTRINLPDFLRLFPQVGSVVTLIICTFIGFILLRRYNSTP